MKRYTLPINLGSHAKKNGIRISADDGPTQSILTVPGTGRVIAIGIGGQDKDTLYAFCGNKI